MLVTSIPFPAGKNFLTDVFSLLQGGIKYKSRKENAIGSYQSARHLIVFPLFFIQSYIVSFLHTSHIHS